MRGKPKADASDVETRRIIPARAGQTSACDSSASSCPDHPRACGANQVPDRGLGAGCGSSPRVRGKPARKFCSTLHLRIIPARAGQTGRFCRRLALVSDHPRACGANMGGNPEAEAQFGSSPRVRGKPRVLGCDPFLIRIIPARAGQTKILEFVYSGSPDHPRACGANNATQTTARYANGSSPRVRGKHVGNVGLHC